MYALERKVGLREISAVQAVVSKTRGRGLPFFAVLGLGLGLGLGSYYSLVFTVFYFEEGSGKSSVY